MGKKQVVVAYDFSEVADVALRRAIDIGCRAPDHVLHVVTVVGRHDYHVAANFEQRLSDLVRAVLDEKPPTEPVEFYAHARIGEPVEEILGVAKDVGADMIVIGSHGRTGIRRLILGSVSEAVVRRAGCAVVIARPKEYPEVALEKVLDVGDVAHPTKPIPHRYSYTSSIARTRPDEWPIS